jgi:hypothetical protein
MHVSVLMQNAFDLCQPAQDQRAVFHRRLSLLVEPRQDDVLHFECIADSSEFAQHVGPAWPSGSSSTAAGAAFNTRHSPSCI